MGPPAHMRVAYVRPKALLFKWLISLCHYLFSVVRTVCKLGLPLSIVAVAVDKCLSDAVQTDWAGSELPTRSLWPQNASSLLQSH